MKHGKTIIRAVLITAFWLGVWTLAALAVGLPLLFPTPLSVVKRLLELLGQGEFYRITALSFGRVLLGVVTAILAGVALSFATARFSVARDALHPVMTVIKSTPVASFVVLAVLWMGADRVTSFITLLIVLPVVWTNLDTGFAEINPQLDEVTRVYRMSPLRRLRVLILPSLRPYFVSACRTSFGLAFKAGIAAEIIVLPKHAIGTKIFEAKTYIEAEDMFAWTAVVVLVTLLVEFVFTRMLKKLEKKQPQQEERYAEI